MSFQAAIFDMDGTILDTLGDLHASVNASLAWAGFPPRTMEEVRAFVGNGAAKLIERAVPAGTDGETTARVLAYYKPYYRDHAQRLTRPYPGVPAALAALKAAGVRLAVVSNKPDLTTRDLAARYFPGLFDAAVGARDDVAVKPAPDMLLGVMEHLGVTAGQTVYVGDSDVDIVTAKNAGTACVSVAWGFRDEAFLRESGASCLVRDSGGLCRAILG